MHTRISIYRIPQVHLWILITYIYFWSRETIQDNLFVVEMKYLTFHAINTNFIISTKQSITYESDRNILTIYWCQFLNTISYKPKSKHSVVIYINFFGCWQTCKFLLYIRIIPRIRVSLLIVTSHLRMTVDNSRMSPSHGEYARKHYTVETGKLSAGNSSFY